MNIICLLISLTVLKYSHATQGDDFYSILGVTRNADLKDIRKAYKKLALILHPDKNKENETANESFLKITKAYEILKDPETRKKYDLFGEQTVSYSTRNTWQQEYHDYTYFTTRFGFFDDNDNIITLTEGDFDNNIKESGETNWFIFFYNPHCDKCYELRKVWQDVANDLEGVIQIAAVNCKEDISLCSKLGYVHVPRFVLFSDNIQYAVEMSHDKYHKSVEELVDFVMSHIRSPLIQITKTLWNTNPEKQWVLCLCNDQPGLNKLSIILENMIMVGQVSDTDLCSEIYFDYKIAPLIFWQTRDIGTVQSFAVQPIYGHTNRQLADQVLQIMVPDPLDLHWNKFKEIQAKIMSDETEKPWLLCFYLGDISQYSLLLRRLAAILSNIKIGTINCGRYSAFCQHYRVNHYPTWAVLKQKSGSVEVHYGRETLNDLVTFVKDSIRAINFKYLTVNEFIDAVSSNEPWIIIWSASWCPPCRRFLPEIRRTSTAFKDTLNFGMIDCVEYRELCIRYNIRSYPTVRFHRNKEVYHFFGPYTGEGLKIFAQEMLEPKIIYVNRKNFQELENKKEDELYIVLYFSPLCGSCHTLHSQWRYLALEISLYKNMKIAEVDCIQLNEICRKQRISFYPTVHIYPSGTVDLMNFNIYRGNHNYISILKTIQQFTPSNQIQHVFPDEIQTLIRSFSVSLILFYDTIDAELNEIIQEYFRIFQSNLLPTQMNIRLFNCKMDSKICQDEDIKQLPQIVLYDFGTRHFINSHSYLDIINDIKTFIYLPSHDEL